MALDQGTNFLTLIFAPPELPTITLVGGRIFWRRSQCWKSSSCFFSSSLCGLGMGNPNAHSGTEFPRTEVRNPSSVPSSKSLSYQASPLCPDRCQDPGLWRCLRRAVLILHLCLWFGLFATAEGVSRPSCTEHRLLTLANQHNAHQVLLSSSQVANVHGITQ